MENPEQYYNKDGWPNESDRAVFLRLSSETPVLEVKTFFLIVLSLCNLYSSIYCIVQSTELTILLRDDDNYDT